MNYLFDWVQRKSPDDCISSEYNLICDQLNNTSLKCCGGFPDETLNVTMVFFLVERYAKPGRGEQPNYNQYK